MLTYSAMECVTPTPGDLSSHVTDDEDNGIIINIERPAAAEDNTDLSLSRLSRPLTPISEKSQSSGTIRLHQLTCLVFDFYYLLQIASKLLLSMFCVFHY